MEDKRDYENLREFQKSLRDLTVDYLKTKVIYPLNSQSNDELGLLISIIEKDSEHELYPERENFTFISAVCKELDAYIKELGFSRDPSTRKAGLEFLEETLCNIQILSDPYSKQITVTVDFKNYTIKGLSGFTSWSTAWLIKYPGAFANKLKSFSLKWKNLGVNNIIEELIPNESRRAIEEKKNTLLNQPRGKKESEVSSEEDSDVYGPDQTHQPHEDKKPLPNTANDQGADSDSDEYTYESYYEDETEGSDDEVVGYRTPVIKPSTRARLVSKRSFQTPGGRTAEEEIWEESLDGDEEYSGEAEFDAEEDDEYGRGYFRTTVADPSLHEGDSQDDFTDSAASPASPAPSPDKRASTGFSAIKQSYPGLYKRMVRLSMDRNSLSVERRVEQKPQESETKRSSEPPSPMSALLAETEQFLEENSRSNSRIVDEIGLFVGESGDEEEENSEELTPRALNFTPAGSNAEEY